MGGETIIVGSVMSDAREACEVGRVHGMGS